MKTPFLAAALIALTVLAVPTRAQTPAETAAIQKQIEANGDAVSKAIRAGDFATLEKIWSPQMLVNSPGNNILTRDQVFQAIRENKLKYSDGDYNVESFYVVGDVAIEMGRETVVMSNGPVAGKPMVRRYTDVWQHTGDTWVQIARQATILMIDGGAVYGHPTPPAAMPKH